MIALLNALTQVEPVIVMTQDGPSAATAVSLAFLSIISLRMLERGMHYKG